MHCEQFMEYAADWMDGNRSAEAEAHRTACTRCGSLIADLEAIRTAAPLLGQIADGPSERVWLAVKSELKAEGIIRPQQSWFDRLAALVPSIPRPALAGAYAALLAASGLFFLTGSPNPNALEIPIAETAPAAPVFDVPNQLSKVEQGTMWSVHAHNPAVAASYRQNMAIVDNFITVCEKKVEEDPQNDVLRDYLMSAYQQKADLLASMLDRGAQGE